MRKFGETILNLSDLQSVLDGRAPYRPNVAKHYSKRLPAHHYSLYNSNRLLHALVKDAFS